jgi:hypothetical protein
MKPESTDWRKYVIVLFITVMLFLTATYVSSFLGGKKIQELQKIQDDIAIDILSSETQFSLLSELSCKNVSSSTLSQELSEFGSKLEWGENNLGSAEELAYLKKYYSLLEIKDYLLLKRIAERCGENYAFILYFYTTAENCSECERQGIVLSRLRALYPDLRVYSFDYSTDLSAVQAMLDIYKIEDTKLPALIVDDEALTGFRSIEELGILIEETFDLKTLEEIEAEKTPLDTEIKTENTKKPL